MGAIRGSERWGNDKDRPIMPWTDFIPNTMERVVAPNITFRPYRAWSTGVFAGEGLSIVGGDRSGCLRDDGRTCHRPLTVTHRIYTNIITQKQISCFLSYPNAMGVCDEYFWEIYPVGDDVERFTSETEMEQKVVELLSEAANAQA